MNGDEICKGDQVTQIVDYIAKKTENLAIKAVKMTFLPKQNYNAISMENLHEVVIFGEYKAAVTFLLMSYYFNYFS